MRVEYTEGPVESGSRLDRFFNWKWLPLFAWATLALLFVFLNRGAYRSYFDGTDLVKLEQFSQHSPADYLLAMVSPVFKPGFDDPFGRLLFGVLGKVWRGSPLPYILLIHAMHLINVGLLIILALALGLGPRVATLAAGVFAIHGGAAEVFWLPGHVVEVECAFFVLLTLLAWIKHRPILSALAFWLGVESDSTSVLLPLGLGLYVLWIRKDNARWLGLHAGVMMFGLLQLALGMDWQFAPSSLWRNFTYYVDELLVFTYDEPMVRYLVLLLGLVISGKRARFAYALFFCLLIPLLWRPGRPGEWSIYLPILGVALFLGLLSDLISDGAMNLMAACMTVFWLLLQIPTYLDATKDYALKSAQVRNYVETFATYSAWPPDGSAVLLDEAPEWLGLDGVRAALHLEGLTIPIEPVATTRGRAHLSEPSFMLLDWTSHRSLLMVRKDAERQPETMLRFEDGFTVLDLGSGWFDHKEASRWSAPEASLRLTRPDWGDQFVIGVDIPKSQLAALNSIRLDISSGGTVLWGHTFTKSGAWTVTWKALADPPIGSASEYHLVAKPAWTLPGTNVQVGLKVSRIGYQSSKWPK